MATLGMPAARDVARLWRIVLRDPIEGYDAMRREYGDAVRLPFTRKRAFYLLSRPEYAEHVLVAHQDRYVKAFTYKPLRAFLGDGLLTSEGEKWQAQRRTIQPVFKAKRIAGKADVIAQEAMGLVKRLREHEGGAPVDISHEMTGLTLGVLGRALLDADLDAFESIGESFEAVQDQAMFEMMTLNAVPLWTPLPRQLRFRRARRELRLVVDSLADEYAQRGGDDVLSRLIEVSRAQADPRAGRQLLRDELVTLLLAGHDTTASTLSWALHLIDRHPEVGERMRAEAAGVLTGETVVYEDLHRLPYTAMVVQEVMRLYPPVWLLPREAVAADRIGPHALPAGADVLICPYTLHRHPEFWPEPDRFDPERFAAQRVGERHRFAYIPFGAGPRVCVGSSLGMMEATIVLATLARDLRLRTAPGHRVVAEPMLTLRARGGLPMTVHAADSRQTPPS